MPVLDIDLLDDRIIASPGVRDALRQITVKHETDATVQVRFWRDRRQVELDPGAEGRYGIKSARDYSSDPLFLAGSWVKTGAGETAVYTFSPAADGSEIGALLAAAASAGSDYILGMLEVYWVELGYQHRSSNYVEVAIWNDVLKDTDGTPLSLPTPEDWLAARIIQPITSSLTIDPGTSAITIGSDHWGKRLDISAPLDITFPTPDTGQAGRRVALYLYGSASVTLTNAGFSGVLTTGYYIAECIVADWFVQSAAMDNVQVVSAAFFASLTTEQQAAGTYFIYDA